MPTIIEEIEIKYKEGSLNKLNSELDDAIKGVNAIDGTKIEVNTTQAVKETNKLTKSESDLSKQTSLTDRAVSDLSKNMAGKYSDSAKKASKETDNLAASTKKAATSSGEISSSFKSLADNLLSSIPGYNQFSSILSGIGPIASRVGLAFTGVVGAVGLLITAPIGLFFSRTEEGAELLERKLAGVSAEAGFLLDKLGEIGGSLFSGDFSGAGKKFVEFLNITAADREKIRKEGEDIQGRIQEQEDIQRGNIVPLSEARREQARLNAQLFEQAENLEDISNKEKALIELRKKNEFINVTEIQNEKATLKILEDKVKIKGTGARDELLKEIELSKARILGLQAESSQFDKYFNKRSKAIGNEKEQLIKAEQARLDALDKAQKEAQALIKKAQDDFKAFLS